MLDSDLIYSIFVNAPVGELTVQQILRFAEPFRIAETNIRSALSRMRARSVLKSRKEGKNSLYSLCVRGAAIGKNVSLHFRGLDWRSWDGSYWAASFSVPDPKERYRIQRKLGAYRFRALYPGLWIRPFHAEEPVEEVFRETIGSGSFDLMRGPFAGGISKERIRSLYDLDAVGRSLARAARTIETSLKGAAGLDAAGAFVEWLSTGDSLVKALFSDPLLPPPLLPEGWPAAGLRRDFAEWNGVYRTKSGPFMEAALSDAKRRTK